MYPGAESTNDSRQRTFCRLLFLFFLVVDGVELQFFAAVGALDTAHLQHMLVQVDNLVAGGTLDLVDDLIILIVVIVRTAAALIVLIQIVLDLLDFLLDEDPARPK